MKKDNLKILILIGIPASGKSTWAKDYVRRNPDWIRVSRDDFRLMLKTAQVCEPKIEDLITVLMFEVIRKSLMKKLNVIIDNTNLKVRYINQFVDEFKYYGDVDFRVFDISLDKAIERDNNREMKVGEGPIKKMYNDYKILLDSFGFQPVKMIRDRETVLPNFQSELPNAVVFDIDGTLAIMKNRGPFDWKNVHRDDVNLIVAEQIHFHRSKGRKILIVSGRDGVCRKETEEWMELYGIHFDEFFMRPENDYRKDTHIKREIYYNDIKPRYNILAVYDDRLSVVKTWNELGLFVFCVNQGLIEF